VELARAPLDRRAPASAVLLTCPAPVVAPHRFLELPIEGEALLWSESAGEVWSFAGRGEVARASALASEPPAALRERAASALASARGERHVMPARLFGGLAFDPADERRDDAPWAPFGAASFALPRWLYGVRGGEAFLRLAARPGEAREAAALLERTARALGDLPPARRAPSPPAAIAEPPDEAEWEALVDSALAAIRAGRARKIVTARRASVAAPVAFDVPAALARLRDAHSACLVFALQRGAATFLGATPERLVTVSGLALSTEAVAGSIPRAGSRESEAAALLASDKDRREQALVVDGIVEALGPLCAELTVPSAPRVRTLAHLHHLVTPIEARLAAPLHALDAARALHPTPAVSGLPKAAATCWIAEHERAPRGLYAGPIGWVDEAGDGAFAVALRSALVEGARAWAYAGAGIVEGSSPALELDETRTKLAAVLAALGAAP
jgi:menaquinone-specific isochorismate synthase